MSFSKKVMAVDPNERRTVPLVKLNLFFADAGGIDVKTADGKNQTPVDPNADLSILALHFYKKYQTEKKVFFLEYAISKLNLIKEKKLPHLDLLIDIYNELVTINKSSLAETQKNLAKMIEYQNQKLFLLNAPAATWCKLKFSRDLGLFKLIDGGHISQPMPPSLKKIKSL